VSSHKRDFSANSGRSLSRILLSSRQETTEPAEVLLDALNEPDLDAVLLKAAMVSYDLR